jgi:uncharacterized membrane protein
MLFPKLGDRPLLLRVIAVRPRLVSSVFSGLATALLLPQSLHGLTRAIIGWNVGAVLYLALAAHMMLGATSERMRARAEREDEGKIVVLALVIVAALMSLGALAAQLASAKDFLGELRYAHVALAVLTILTSWALIQTMFAVHYAHEYYISGDDRQPGRGLNFPGEPTPDYSDFLYFAYVIGTSSQTADVSFTSRSMRRIGAIHCVLAFFFNTTVLALTVNLVSGLF